MKKRYDLFRTRKGKILLAASLAMLLSIVFGLTTYYAFKGWQERQDTGLEPQLYLGEKQINLLLTANLAEKDLFFLDQSAKYAVSEALLNLALKAGFQKEPNCGEFLGYNLIKDKDGYCDMSRHLDDEIEREMNSIFYQYAMRYSARMPTDFEYSLIQLDDVLNVIGMTEENMEYEVGKELMQDEEFVGKTGYLCHYCGTMKEQIDPTRMKRDYTCDGDCCKGPCPPDALNDGIPLVAYLNQCGETEVKQYESGCDTDETGTVCFSGCGPTSMNMILEYNGIPSDFWYFFNKQGDDTCYVKEGYGYVQLIEFARSKNINAKYQQANPGNPWNDLIKATQEGPVLMLHDQEGSGVCTKQNLNERLHCAGGHYIVVLYANNLFAIVNDPYTRVNNPGEYGHNLVLSRTVLQKAWAEKGYVMITTEGKNFDPNYDLYKDMIIPNENDNWVKYYPLDSSDEAHFTVNYVFGNVYCSDSYSNELYYGVSFGSKTGDNVYAVANGIVTYAGNADFTDTPSSSPDREYYTYNVVEIDHGSYYSRYYFNSEIFVSKDDTVRAGQRIAKTGKLIGTTTDFFYFEIHKKDENNPRTSSRACSQWLIEPVKDAVDPLQFYYQSGAFTAPLKFSPMTLKQPAISSLAYYDYIQDNQVIEFG